MSGRFRFDQSISNASSTGSAPVRKAPIHNPYDKFSQPQFDDFIHGITSALRGALSGFDYDARNKQEAAPTQSASYAPVAPGSQFDTGQSISAILMRDKKGKGRDPAEGPGLNSESGDEYSPISIDMDGSDDEVDHERDELFSNAEGDEEQSGSEEEYSSEEEARELRKRDEGDVLDGSDEGSEGSYSSEDHEAPDAVAGSSPPRNRANEGSEGSEEEYEEDEYESDEGPEELQPPAVSFTRPTPTAEDVIEVLSDDDEDEGNDEYSSERGSSPRLGYPSNSNSYGYAGDGETGYIPHFEDVDEHDEGSVDEIDPDGAEFYPSPPREFSESSQPSVTQPLTRSRSASIASGGSQDSDPQVSAKGDPQKISNSTGVPTDNTYDHRDLIFPGRSKPSHSSQTKDQHSPFSLPSLEQGFSRTSDANGKAEDKDFINVLDHLYDEFDPDGSASGSGRGANGEISARFDASPPIEAGFGFYNVSPTYVDTQEKSGQEDGSESEYEDDDMHPPLGTSDLDIPILPYRSLSEIPDDPYGQEALSVNGDYHDGDYQDEMSFLGDETPRYATGGLNLPPVATLDATSNADQSELSLESSTSETQRALEAAESTALVQAPLQVEENPKEETIVPNEESVDVPIIVEPSPEPKAALSATLEIGSHPFDSQPQNLEKAQLEALESLLGLHRGAGVIPPICANPDAGDPSEIPFAGIIQEGVLPGLFTPANASVPDSPATDPVIPQEIQAIQLTVKETTAGDTAQDPDADSQPEMVSETFSPEIQDLDQATVTGSLTNRETAHSPIVVPNTPPPEPVTVQDSHLVDDEKRGVSSTPKGSSNLELEDAFPVPHTESNLSVEQDAAASDVDAPGRGPAADTAPALDHPPDASADAIALAPISTSQPADVSEDPKLPSQSREDLSTPGGAASSMSPPKPFEEDQDTSSTPTSSQEKVDEDRETEQANVPVPILQDGALSSPSRESTPESKNDQGRGTSPSELDHERVVEAEDPDADGEIDPDFHETQDDGTQDSNSVAEVSYDDGPKSDSNGTDTPEDAAQSQQPFESGADDVQSEQQSEDPGDISGWTELLPDGQTASPDPTDPNEDPFKLMGTNSAYAPGEVKDLDTPVLSEEISRGQTDAVTERVSTPPQDAVNSTVTPLADLEGTDDIGPTTSDPDDEDVTVPEFIADNINPPTGSAEEPLTQEQEAREESPSASPSQERPVTTDGVSEVPDLTPSVPVEDVSDNRPPLTEPSTDDAEIGTNGPQGAPQESDEQETPAAASPIRGAKRKREEPKTSRIPRVKSKRTAAMKKVPVTSAQPASKAKGKEKSPVRRESISSSSGASAASRQLRATSATSSRASSVNPPSISAGVGVLPTVPEALSSDDSNHSILFHKHGRPGAPRHHSHLPMLVVQQQAQTGQRSKPTSKSADSATVSPATSVGTPPPLSQDPKPSGITPTRTTSLTRLPSSSSPVTRSNCRFRKISIPREAGGPRVYFIVPGCSLGNKEFIDEHEIADHGNATYEESQQMLSDISTLENLPEDLVAVLRQLVGLDAAQQDAFYLPLSGEEVKRKSVTNKSSLGRRSTRDSLAGSSRPSIDSIFPSSSSSRRPPHSAATSISTTHTAGSRNTGGTREYSASVSSSESDHSDDGDAEPKQRTKKRKVEESASSPVVEAAPDASSQKTAEAAPKKKPARRTRKLTQDAAAYQPTLEEEEEEEDIEEDTQQKRKRKRSLRKAKTMDTSTANGATADDAESRKPKRARVKRSATMATVSGTTAPITRKGSQA